MRGISLKTIILIALGGAAWAFLAYKTSVGIDDFHALQNRCIQYHREFPFQSMALFFGVYLCTTALSLPIASLLTLAAGAIFGFWRGLLLVSFSSTLGATLAFGISRCFLRNWVQTRFQEQLKTINSGLESEGSLYLLGLRLSPLFPFFLINIVSGLTPISAKTFYWISQLGMLPGTALYVNAGSQLSAVTSLKNILTPPIIFSLTLAGTFPILVKRLLKNKNPGHP